MTTPRQRPLSMQRVRFLDQQVVLDLQDMRMVDSVARLFGAHCTAVDSRHRAVTADITVRREPGVGSANAASRGGTPDADTQAYRMLEPASGVSGDHRLCDRLLIGTTRTLAEVRERVQYRLIADQAGYLMFHGAIAVHHGEALLFPGQSGAGKTTLSAWLIGQGFSVLSDELVAVDAVSQATGFGQALNLKSGSIPIVRDFPWLSDAFRTAIPSALDGCFLPCITATPSWRSLKSLIFLNYQRDAPFAAQRLSSGLTTRRLIESLLNARNFDRLAIPQLVAMAETLPAWSLVYNTFEPLAAWLDRH